MHFQTRNYWAERAHRTSLRPIAAPEPSPLARLATGALRALVAIGALTLIVRASAAGWGL